MRRSRRGIRTTKEGRRFVLATLLIAMAALNTGNNLIYLILAMMLSVLSISLLVPLLNLRGLVLRVSALQPLFAKQNSWIDITVTNGKQLLPSYSLKIFMGESGRGYIPFVAASSEAPGRVSVLFERRGVYSYRDFTVESSFPFIFFEARRRLNVEGSLTVYPEIKEKVNIALTSPEGDDAYALRRGIGDELLSLRDFADGDDLKSVHWRASAKAGRLMVREFAVSEPKKIMLILDDILPMDADAFEKAVSYAASLARKLITVGFMVGLRTSEKQLPPVGGAEHFFRILDCLAVVEEKDTDSYPSVPGGGILILKSESSGLKRLISRADKVLYATAL